MADPSEVGKYGTIRVMKRRDPSSHIAVYPIDDEECTFGRNMDCSVRLYYPDVASLHCKLIFEERKALLQVFGETGAIVDGCVVYPTSPAKGVPTTVPLVNGSYFEIHKKRFQFSYPPKEIRQQLFTPEANRRRSVRMSMILSADVFSPRPSPNPRENLRVLQSPLKPFTTHNGEAPEVVKLVDGNHPRVVEEEQDLIILEDVQPKAPDDSPTTPAPTQQVFRTPRRRSAPSLHRAVLIRSAQRVAHIQELVARQRRQEDEFEEIVLEEDEDVRDEEEVEEAVSGEMVISDESEGEISIKERDSILSGLDSQEQDITEAEDYEEEIEEEDAFIPPPQFITPLQVGRIKPLGSFMTPQARLFPQRPSKEDQPKAERTGPQRPPPGARLSLAPGLGAGTVVFKEPEPKIEQRPPSPVKKKPEVTEEERNAIMERRKSAAQFPDPDFAHVPGLGARRSSVHPLAMPPSPFKAIRENLEGGEDTKSVMKKMEESLENMRRKSLANVGLGRPSMGLGRGRDVPESPPKPKTGFSLLSSPMRPIDLFPRSPTKVLRNDESHLDSVDENSGTGASEAYADAIEVMPEKNEIKEPTSRYPETPRLGDIRHIFSKAQAEVGIATPEVRGVRELFKLEKDKARVLRTPRMSSVRQLFIENKVPPTPAFDGIEEMMHLDEGYDEEGQVQTAEVTPDDEEREAMDEPEVQLQPPAKLTKTSITRIPKTAARTKPFRSLRATPLTGSSAFADDEATPDTAQEPAQSRSKRALDAGVPEAAVVHRGSRTARKPVGADSDMEEPDKAKARQIAKKSASTSKVEDVTTEPISQGKTHTRRGRVPKVKEEEVSVASPIVDADAQTKARPRSRAKKLESTVAESEAVAVAAPVIKTTRRGVKAPLTDEDSSAPAKPVRRGTRARSRSVDQDRDSTASINASATKEEAPRTTKRSGRSKTSSDVETIVEEETRIMKPASRSRRGAKAESDESVDDAEAPTLRKAGGRKATKATSLVTIEEDEDKNDKENNPEGPTSPTESAGEVPPKVAKKAARAIKPSSRSTAARSRTDDEQVIPTRTTRTRTVRK